MQLDAEPVYDGVWLRRDLRRLRLERIGFIFRFHNLLPFLNSTENVVEAMELFGTTTRRARERTAALLDYLDVGHRRHAMPGQLSGGEAQRGRSLGHWPTVRASSLPTSRPPRSRWSCCGGRADAICRD